MKPLTAEMVTRAYLVVVLVLAVLVSSPLQIGLALGLLAVQLFFWYKPVKPELNLALTIGTLVLAPLVLEAFVGVYAVLLMVPALYLLDEGLRRYASTLKLSYQREGRRAGEALKRSALGLLLVLAVSVIVWNFALMLTAAALLGYLGVVVAYVFRRVPKAPLVGDKSWSRLIVGETETKKVSFKGQANIATNVKLEPASSWVEVGSPCFSLPAKGNMETAVLFTPPLAGPSRLQIKAVSVDAWGLIETAQVLEPIDLHIIPRAKFAAWLARKYLEQTSSGVGLSVSVQRSNPLAAKRGVEFYGSRPYQSGDRLKDIDWRHSYMLGELIVKEFTGAQGQVGIIVADLTANDLEDADRLAYNLVMSALTLATEGVPSAVAAYNQADVVAVTQPMNPRETLKRTMELTEKITVVEPKLRVLQFMEMRRLKRSIGQLNQISTEPAQRLSQIVELEIDVNQEAAEKHPATLALSKAVKNLQGPAVLTVASSIRGDSDALLYALERLKERGFRVVTVASP